MENFNFKKFFKSRREFAEKTKSIYLAAFNEKFGATTKPAPSFAFNYVLRGAGVFAAMMLTSAWKVLSGQGVTWKGRNYKQ